MERYNYLCLKEADPENGDNYAYFYDFSDNRIFKTDDQLIIKRHNSDKFSQTPPSLNERVNVRIVAHILGAISLVPLILFYIIFSPLKGVLSFMLFIIIELIYFLLFHEVLLRKRNKEMLALTREYDVSNGTELCNLYLEEKALSKVKRNNTAWIISPFLISGLVCMFEYDNIKSFFILLNPLLIFVEYAFYTFDVDHLPYNIHRFEKIMKEGADME